MANRMGMVAVLSMRSACRREAGRDEPRLRPGSPPSEAHAGSWLRRLRAAIGLPGGSESCDPRR